jgi:hypothetical protein
MSKMRVEVRAYDGGREPTLVKVERYACDENGVSEDAGKAAWELSRKHSGVEYVVVEGDDEDVTDTWGVTPTDLRVQAEDSGSWQREMAMEAGMLHGVGAYNEVMGWD